MDEASKHSYGGGQQRNQHPRPFFYVQPPSQPYYMYQQWHLNNPYSQYGLQGGFNYGRPCMHPYQYMQYPGFIFPHAPLYPMDYRRMFEPRFHAPAWSDAPRQQHQHQHQPPRRETACSEVQTDPSDVITKLMENLEPPGAERELDSGVASHSSGMFSPVEEKKSEEQSGAQLLPAPPDDSRLLSPAMAFSDSTTAVYDADSSRRSLEALSPQASWPGEMEEELPLDSSSVHEECADSEHHEPEEQLLPGENMEVTGIHSDTSVTEQNVLPLDDEEFRKQTDSATPSLTSSFASCQPVSKEAKRGGNVFHAEGQTTSLADDPSYQILKLPLESVLTSGAARAGRLSSPAAPYYYNYLSMQTTHERMSVLSPSLDELSSRDEMFSTDLEDMELFPKRVCAGRRLAGVVSGQAGGKDELEEAWLPGSTRFLCACCGNNLAKGGGRSKAHSSKAYRDDGGDSEESRYRRGCEQPVVRKISAPRKSHSVPARHGVKPWLKRGQYKEASDTVESEKGHDLCKQDSADGEDGAAAAGELQCRTCRDSAEAAETETETRFPAGDKRRTCTDKMSAPRKVMYHRPRDDDDDDDEDDDDKDDDEPPPSHWERDMEAATSTLHRQSFGLGPQAANLLRGARAAPEAQQQAAAGPSGAARLDQQQQHRKPFFYIQPSQPYLPVQSVQWPLPLPPSYNPYFGYPGLGYGMPMMPPYQPSPFMEPPAFVLPHTHLHLVDYRRMLSPQYYQTMAFHARRFRYQQSGPAREVASCEVQTEPLSACQRTSTPGTAGAETSGAPRARNGGDAPAALPLSPGVAVRPECPVPEHQDGGRTPASSGSFLIQTEEVRIECRTSPVGLQLLHEATEVSHCFSQDLAQPPAADQSEQSLQACPDILLVGSEKVPQLEERSHAEHVAAAFDFTSADDDVEETRSERDACVTPQSFEFKVAHMPFDPKYLEELQKMEATVWSMEETLMPSPDSVIQDGCTEFADEAAEVPSAEALVLSDEELLPVVEMPPLLHNTLEHMELPAKEGFSAADLCLTMDVPAVDETPAEQRCQSEETPHSLLSSESPLLADGDQHGQEVTVQDHQDTSFESLPTYLPSTSWLADFDSSYYWSKTPPPPKKQSKAVSRCPLEVPSRRRKLDMEFKEQPVLGKVKERYKPKGKAERRSLSDHECCHRSFGGKASAPYASQREPLCSSCLLKTRMFSPAALGLDGRVLKRKALPFHQWNDDLLLPTCDTCKSHTRKRLGRKGSTPDVRGPRHGHDSEGESSENSCSRAAPTWKAGNIKRPLAPKQNVEKHPAATYRKPKEKNCVCNEAQRRPAAWDRLHHCPHGNAIREMDENCAVAVFPQDKRRSAEQIYQTTRRMPGEKWWRSAAVVVAAGEPGANGPKSDGRSQHTNKHKTSQSQGTRRKDTRC